MKKKLVLLIGIMTCTLALTACASTKATFDYNADEVKSTAKQYMDSWNQADFSSYKEADIDKMLSTAQIDEATSEVYTTWSKTDKEIGDFVEVKDTRIEENGDTISVVFTADYSKAKRDVEFSVPFDEYLQVDPNAISVEVQETLGDKLEGAVVNMVLGMGTVFIVLIFISFVISLFKVIPKIQQRMADKQKAEEVNVVASIDHTVARIVEQEEEQVELLPEEDDLVNDTELVAVITAAIMASMGNEVPADGLMVRSIRRAKTNKWQKA
ncbi:MAG TPA: OadG family transporter subunit [Lachnospiraceae bacterium]|nr:OadG family transporter subunit [Lachnospiraceae bacterium]